MERPQAESRTVTTATSNAAHSSGSTCRTGTLNLVPERKWAIRDYVPLHQAGLFSGEGGTGKSILELAKNVAHVTGRDWLGLLPEPGPTIYIGAEDSEDEVHIRLAAIAKHYGVTFKELVEGGLHVLCLLGEDATLV